ncbi:MAG: cell division protein FtsQ/DivIB [Nitrospinales bacterium]
MNYFWLQPKSTSAGWGLSAPPVQKIRKSRKVRQSRTKRKSRFKILEGIRTCTDIIATSILLSVLSYGAFQGYRYLTTAPYFSVKQVEINGNSVLETSDVMALAGTLRGSNIFKLDLDEVKRRLDSHPRVLETRVERTLPESVRINIQERIPFARIKMDRVYTMDKFGVLLAEAEDGTALDHLPLVTGMTAKKVRLGENLASENLIRALQVMHYLNLLDLFWENSINQVEIINNHRAVFATQNGETKIFMDLNHADENFSNLKLIHELIADKFNSIEHIDLSFKDQVVVRLYKSSEPMTSNN